MSGTSRRTILALCLLVMLPGCLSVQSDPSSAQLTAIEINNYGDEPRPVSVTVYRNGSVYKQWNGTVPSTGGNTAPGEPPKGSKYPLKNLTEPGQYRIVAQSGSTEESIEVEEDRIYLVRIDMDDDSLGISTWSYQTEDG